MRVTRYETAEAFLAQARPDDFDCLLLDHQLPAMTGLELLENLRARHIDVPAIVMTGSPDGMLARRAARAGSVVFLHKPMKFKELLAAIDTAALPH